MNKDGVAFSIAAEWDDRPHAQIILEREYKDWFNKRDLSDVFMRVNANNGFSHVELRGRENLRALATAILAEIEQDEKHALCPNCGHAPGYYDGKKIDPTTEPAKKTS